MKRNLLLGVMYLATLAASAFNTIVLSHQGNQTFYDNGEFPAALAAAQDNDTIFVPSMSIPGFTIERPITVMGTGEKTYITGDVMITLPDSLTKISAALLDGVNVTGAVRVKRIANATGGWIRMTKMQNFDLTPEYESIPVKSFILERCHVAKYCNLSNAVHTLLQNCKVYELYGLGTYEGSHNIDHSFIHSAYLRGDNNNSTHFRGCIKNSIIYSAANASGVGANVVTVINSILLTSAYDFPSVWINYDSFRAGVTGTVCNTTTLDATEIVYEKLLAEGWKADDGTTIGSTGGSTPFTLEPSLPAVKTASVLLDPENRTLNVKVNFTTPAVGTLSPVTPEETEQPTE